MAGDQLQRGLMPPCLALNTAVVPTPGFGSYLWNIIQDDFASFLSFETHF